MLFSPLRRGAVLASRILTKFVVLFVVNIRLWPVLNGLYPCEHMNAETLVPGGLFCFSSVLVEFFGCVSFQDCLEAALQSWRRCGAQPYRVRNMPTRNPPWAMGLPASRNVRPVAEARWRSVVRMAARQPGSRRTTLPRAA